MEVRESQRIRRELSRLVPGGSHTYAKGDDQWPEDLAPIIARGSGATVIDVDGNEYIEYGSGLRAAILGHAHPAIVSAVEAGLGNGSNFVRPSQLELEAAERFIRSVPTMEMVKFTKNGSDATTAAVKLARAATGRDMVAFCADHPFFSTDDWFIGRTEMDRGIPSAVSRLSLGFPYADLAALQGLFDRHPGRIAGVVMEVEREVAPPPDYLVGIRQLCDREGALLIFDEIVTGFRWAMAGAHAEHGVVPDLAAFGKAMANGFPLAALAGRRDVMELGGLDHSSDRVFLLSTTYGADAVGLSASIATQELMEREPVHETVHAQGASLRVSLEKVAAELGLSDYFQVLGRDCCLLYRTTDASSRPSQEFRTLFLQETVERGLLCPSFVVGLPHNETVIDRTVEIVAAALQTYAKALEDGPERHLRGRPVAPVFRRRNHP